MVEQAAMAARLRREMGHDVRDDLCRHIREAGWDIQYVYEWERGVWVVLAYPSAARAAWIASRSSAEAGRALTVQELFLLATAMAEQGISLHDQDLNEALAEVARRIALRAAAA